MLRSQRDQTFNGVVSLVTNWDTSCAIVSGVKMSMGKGRNNLLTEKLLNLDFSWHPHLLEAPVFREN